MAELKLAHVDVETTGLSATDNEIIDFAVVFEDGREVHFRVKPSHIENAHPKALEVNGYNPKDWEDAVSQEYAAAQISQLLAGHTIVAHNAKFDYGFLEETLLRHNVPVSFDHHAIDTVGLALVKCRKDGLTKLNLKNVCVFLGIAIEAEIHTAINGARRVKLVYDKLAEYK